MPESAQIAFSRLQALAKRGYRPNFDTVASDDVLELYHINNPKGFYERDTKIPYLLLYDSGLVVATTATSEQRFEKRDEAAFHYFLSQIPGTIWLTYQNGRRRNRSHCERGSFRS